MFRRSPRKIVAGFPGLRQWFWKAVIKGKYSVKAESTLLRALCFYSLVTVKHLFAVLSFKWKENSPYIMFNFSVSVMSILQSFVTRWQKLLHLLGINITSQARASGVSLLRLYFNILPKYKYNSNSIDNNLLFKTKGWNSQDEKPTYILVCSTILSQALQANKNSDGAGWSL